MEELKRPGCACNGYKNDLGLLRIYFVCLFSVLWRVCVWYGVLVDLRGQLSGAGSHLPLCCGGVFLFSAATLSNFWVAGPKLCLSLQSPPSIHHRSARTSRFAVLHQRFLELCAFTVMRLPDARKALYQPASGPRSNCDLRQAVLPEV